MAPNNLHYLNLGLTLDEPKDYQLIKKFFTILEKRERFYVFRNY